MNVLVESFYPKIGQALFDALPIFSEAWLNFDSIEDVWGYEAFYLDANASIRYQNEGLDVCVELLRGMRQAFIDSGLEPFTESFFYMTEAGKFTIDFSYDDISDFGLAGERRNVWIKKVFGENAQIQWE
jgi:Protein of unknown function, DUF600